METSGSNRALPYEKALITDEAKGHAAIDGGPFDSRLRWIPHWTIFPSFKSDRARIPRPWLGIHAFCATVQLDTRGSNAAQGQDYYAETRTHE